VEEETEFFLLPNPQSPKRALVLNFNLNLTLTGEGGFLTRKEEEEEEGLHVQHLTPAIPTSPEQPSPPPIIRYYIFY